jgi:hypothetical protein
LPVVDVFRMDAAHVHTLEHQRKERDRTRGGVDIDLPLL